MKHAMRKSPTTSLYSDQSRLKTLCRRGGAQRLETDDIDSLIEDLDTLLQHNKDIKVEISKIRFKINNLNQTKQDSVYARSSSGPTEPMPQPPVPKSNRGFASGLFSPRRK